VRTRKLLMHRKELERLRGRVQERGLTLVPLRLYWSKGRAKAELGLGQGKKLYDKRAAIRARMERREVDRAMARGRQRRS
jgi:SsrA-binding protein